MVISMAPVSFLIRTPIPFVGLSICNTIIQLHRGSIGCVSKQRQGEDRRSGGSEFFFSVEFPEPEPESVSSVVDIKLSASLNSVSHDDNFFSVVDPHGTTQEESDRDDFAEEKLSIDHQEIQSEASTRNLFGQHDVEFLVMPQPAKQSNTIYSSPKTTSKFTLLSSNEEPSCAGESPSKAVSYMPCSTSDEIPSGEVSTADRMTQSIVQPMLRILVCDGMLFTTQ